MILTADYQPITSLSPEQQKLQEWVLENSIRDLVEMWSHYEEGQTWHNDVGWMDIEQAHVGYDNGELSGQYWPVHLPESIEEYVKEIVLDPEYGMVPVETNLTPQEAQEAILQLMDGMT